MTQIDFFDKDIVSTLLPITTTEPDRVVFLIDRRSTESHDPENVKRAIKEILPKTVIEFRPVTVDDLSDIYSALKDIVEGLEDRDDACIDLTGGTELMSACGYRIAKEYNILSIYVDVRREHVINAETGEIICPVKHIGLETCLSAIGAKRLKDSHDLPHPDEYESILNMCKIIFTHIEDWQALCQHVANQVATSGNHLTVKIPENIGKNKRGIRTLVKGFSDYGFWERADGRDLNDPQTWTQGTYKFTSGKARNYITTFGTWLELFIYIKALEIFDEAALGVVIDWYEGDHIDTQDNEIDVVAMRRSVPIFISCKMRKPVSGDLYEIGFVASRLGGSRAKAILATTYPVKELGISPKRMYQRMKKFKVGLLEASGFEKIPAADVFNQAIQMTE